MSCKHRNAFLIPRTLLAPELAEVLVCPVCREVVAIRLAPVDRHGDAPRTNDR